MTLYLSHSPASAYNQLAIVATEARERDDNEAKGRLMVLDDEIQRQVGALQHEQVCASEEYRHLLACHAQGIPVQALPQALEERWFVRL